jgi:hypothetical protein
MPEWEQYGKKSEFQKDIERKAKSATLLSKTRGRRRTRGRKPRKGKTTARRTPKPKGITIISRKEQPQPVVKVKAAGIIRKSYPLRHVSSTWISQLGYSPDYNEATMVTYDKKGKNRGYAIKDISFKDWEGWVMAHSKGTYFNKRIKRKYKIEQLF